MIAAPVDTMRKQYELVHRVTNQPLPIAEKFSSFWQAATFAVEHDLHANVREIMTAQTWERNLDHPEGYIA